MSDETPLSEAIQGFADLHEWVPLEAEILQCWADRAADLEREDRTECVDAEFLREFNNAWPHEWYMDTYRGEVAVVACVSGEWDEFWGRTLREAMEAMMQAIEEADNE